MNFHYYKSKSQNESYITISTLYNLVNIKKEFNNPFNKSIFLQEGIYNTKNIINYIKNFKVYPKKIIKYKKIIDYLIKHVTIRKLFIKVELASAESSSLGIVTGIIWAVYGILFTPLISYFNFKKAMPELNIIPRFTNEDIIIIECNSIITIKIAHIIVAAIKLISIILRSELNERSSYPGFNEDNYGKHKRNG